MKWGGTNEIRSFKAIISLLIIATIGICICFALEFASQDCKSLQFFLLAVAVISIISSIILWQIDLNSIFRETRSDLPGVKPIWNIFQIGENQKEEEKDAKKNI